MDIEHGPAQGGRRGVELEVAGQADEINGIPDQNGVDGGIISGIVGRVAVVTRLFKAKRCRVIGDYHFNAGSHAPLADALMEVIQGPAAARKQHRHVTHPRAP